jgi:hypothetical protein
MLSDSFFAWMNIVCRTVISIMAMVHSWIAVSMFIVLAGLIIVHLPSHVISFPSSIFHKDESRCLLYFMVITTGVIFRRPTISFITTVLRYSCSLFFFHQICMISPPNWLATNLVTAPRNFERDLYSPMLSAIQEHTLQIITLGQCAILICDWYRGTQRDINVVY